MDLPGIFSEGVVVFDGAMGTMLQSMGLPPRVCPDVWCLARPDAVAEVHRGYVEAGAQVIETNTFGANPVRLARYGVAEDTRTIVLAAVRIAREASQGKALVAGCIGPLGVLVEPLGDFTFDQAYEAFSSPARAFAEAGVDLIIIDTIFDLGEMRAAILACKDNASGIPVIAQMTLDPRGRTSTGTDPESAGVVLQSLGADAVGFNCSVGPDMLVEPVRRFSKVARVPVSVQPNAGLPRLSGGRTEFPMGPEEFASYGPKLVEAGASIVGGCCGTTPEHIRLLKNSVSGLRPGGASGSSGPEVRTRLGAAGMYGNHLGFDFVLASRTKAVFAEEAGLPILIGERINPTGRKRLAESLREGSFVQVKEDAKRQGAAGASVIDVNVGVPLIDEPLAMSGAVRAVQDAVQLPVSIDSASPAAIEAGLKAFVGKALVNSFSLEGDKPERILPFVKRYGAAVIGLTIGKDGIPLTAKGRLEVARKLVEKAGSYGIPPWDVVVDPLSLSVGAQQDQARETLEAIRLIKSELGCRTSLGISNVSYGLPNRPFLNAAFLLMALAQGLDLAIVNPLDERLMDSVRAARVLLHRDRDAREYIAVVGSKTLTHAGERVQAASAQTSGGPDPVAASPGGLAGLDRRIYDAVLDGDKDGIGGFVREALSQGRSPAGLLDDCLIPAINEVGRRFGAGSYFLPQLMLSASAMKAAFDILKPEMSRAKRSDDGRPSGSAGTAGSAGHAGHAGPAGPAGPTSPESARSAGSAVPAGPETRGTVVLATVEGDIHDIGKNIIAVMLENYGFTVVDLGRDVRAETILEEARKASADLVCLSALMTTTMPKMKEVIDLFSREGFDCPVLVGGAATTREFAEQIGAAGYGKDAQEAVSEALRVLRQRKERVV